MQHAVAIVRNVTADTCSCEDTCLETNRFCRKTCIETEDDRCMTHNAHAVPAQRATMGPRTAILARKDEGLEDHRYDRLDEFDLRYACWRPLRVIESQVLGL